MYKIDINKRPFGGIPNKFKNSDFKLKIIFDPELDYFENQIYSDREKYEKLILFSVEPKALVNNENDILEYGNIFDKMYTMYDSVVEKYSTAEIYPPGNCWILVDKNKNHFFFEKDYINIFDINNKKNKLSFVKSHKNFLEGQNFRHEISDLLEKNYNYEIIYPKVPTQKFSILEEPMFHLAIENSKQKNYFTEKIIDSFMSFTVPIYWGCPNISDFFDMDGIIIFNSKKELEFILNNLTEDDYWNRIDSIQKNYETCINNKYPFFYDRIHTKLDNLFK